MRHRSTRIRRAAALTATVALAAGVLTAAAPLVPLTGPDNAECISVESLPVLPLPPGQWYCLTVTRPVADVRPSACDGGFGTWTPAHLTLTAMLPDGGENVSAFADWCIPTVNPTRPDTGLPWRSELFAPVAAQATN